MMRLPFLPTLIVGAAIATMIALGIWQLQRAEWKDGLIAQLRANSQLPATAWPAVPPPDDSLLYRRASGFCTEVTDWRTTAGRNALGETGWSHIASCRTGGFEGPGMQVDMGWSKSSTRPTWRGGPVTGIIVPDSAHRIRLVSAQPAPGLQASAPPSPELTPNNHVFYALQWFFFALAAAVIYWLALRRRQKQVPSAGSVA